MTSAPCCRCIDLFASRTQIVMPTAAPLGGLLAVGEAPGQLEDETGIGFAGQAGKTLDGLLAAHGIHRDCYGQANICRCRPPANRRPTKAEASACLPALVEFITETKPRVLLLVGGTAVSHFLGTGSLFHRIEMSRQAGGQPVPADLCHPALRPLSDTGIIVVPMPHTSGMAWNRKAPNGEPWSTIGRSQVALSVQVLRRDRRL